MQRLVAIYGTSIGAKDRKKRTLPKFIHRGAFGRLHNYDAKRHSARMRSSDCCIQTQTAIKGNTLKWMRRAKTNCA